MSSTTTFSLTRLISGSFISPRVLGAKKKSKLGKCLKLPFIGVLAVFFKACAHKRNDGRSVIALPPMVVLVAYLGDLIFRKKSLGSVLVVLMISGLAGSYCAWADEKPEIFVQMGHLNQVNQMSFSPDGKYALSGSLDGTVKLWDVFSGREIRTFVGNQRGVYSVLFSPDGKHALSGSGDGTIKLWDIATGIPIWESREHTSDINSLSFSPDGKYALSASNDNTIKLWDIATGRLIRTLDGHKEAVNAVSFSPDGKYVLSGGSDGAIILWDVTTGKKIRALRGRNKDEVHAVSFSPDGSLALSGSVSAVKLWNLATGKEVRGFADVDFVYSVAFSPDGKRAVSAGMSSIKMWEVSTGREIRTLEGAGSPSVTFSPDGRRVLAGSWENAPRLFDAASGDLVLSFDKHTSNVECAAFSPDGRLVVSGTYDGSLSLWDVATGKQIRKFWSPIMVNVVSFSPDGRYLLSGSRWNLILWDVATGIMVRKFRYLKDSEVVWVNSISFSPDGQHAITGSEAGPIRVWDVAKGEEIGKFEGDDAKSKDFVSYSPDGKFAISSNLGSLILWEITMSNIPPIIVGREETDVATGKVLRRFTGHTEVVSFASFSPDGKHILSASADKTLKLWDITTGKEIRTFTGHNAGVAYATFSPDGRRAISGSADGILKLWDVATGRELRSFSGIKDELSSLPTTHLGSPALAGSSDKAFSIWETEKIKGKFRSLSISPDGRLALAGSTDGTTHLWNIATSDELVKRVSFGSPNSPDEWIAMTPEGYYNSSLHGHDNINVRDRFKVYGISQFYDVFYRPDIVEAKLKGQDISGLITLTIDDALKNPPPTVAFTSKLGETGAPRLNVCYEVKSNGGGIGEVRLFQNGKLIQSDGFFREAVKLQDNPIQLASLNGEEFYKQTRSIKRLNVNADIAATNVKSKGEVYTDCKEIEATSGENEISLAAFNATNTIQSVMETTSFNSTLKPEDPHLYILAVGLNQYKDSTNNLKYAAKDAADISDRLAKESETIYKPENIHKELLLDNNAGKAQILEKISEIAKKVKANDAFILFVAGHGVLLQNQYYFLTHDFAGDLDDKVLISSNEVVEMSKSIKSLNQLFIFDTCHAGGVDSIISGLYDSRMSVLAKKMGLHIFASANSTQEAIDGYKGNGLFTYTLLDALNNNKNADLNKDARVSIVELGEYTKGLAGDISKSLGHAQTPLIIDFGKDNPAYLIK